MQVLVLNPGIRMQFYAAFAVLIVGYAVFRKLTAKRRAYAAQHITPLKEKIREARADGERRLSPYKEALKVANSRLRGTQRKGSDLEKKINLFSRDFAAEIQSEKERKREGHEIMADLKSRISSKYDDLETAKDDLDSWHRKSRRSFFGNAGRELPKHAIFSQSLNERDSLKGERDDAFRDIKRLKAEKQRAYDQYVQLGKDNLAEIHADIGLLRDLEKEGTTADELMKLKKSNQAFQEEIYSEIREIREEMTRVETYTDEEVNELKFQIKLAWKQYRHPAQKKVN